MLLIAVCLSFVLYTYAGYPLIVHLLARLRDLPVRTAPLGTPPRVSVIIAAYRERGTIADKIATLAAQDHPQDRLEVIVACDGSDDGTAEAARQAGADLMPGRVTVLSLPRGGKPAALNAGAAAAGGDVLVLTDARQRMNPGAVTALCAALSDPTVGVASGELRLMGAAGSGAYWRYEAWIRKSEARAGSVVGVSGALYALPRSLWRPLPPPTILDDVWVPMQVRLSHPRLRVVLTAAAQAFDRAAEDAREFSRKARTLAGNYQLLLLMPALLSPLRNPSFFAFVSHKLCRLLVPFALIALFFATLWQASLAPTPAITFLLLSQLGCYALAAAPPLFGGRRLPLSRLCRTFVVLNAAAVVGLWRVLRHGTAQRWT